MVFAVVSVAANSCHLLGVKMKTELEEHAAQHGGLRGTAAEDFDTSLEPRE